MEETALPTYFGEWLKSRRKELDLTQAELARRAGCSTPALRKIESGERRPSKQLAGLLAKSLEIPIEEQTTFVKVARGELNIERLYPLSNAHPSIYRPTPIPSPPPGNLPRLLTPFIGRELELNTLSQLLRDPQCRLLTIVGPGGIGKTRLAIEISCRHKDLFPDGIWFVPLAPLNSTDYLIPAIADAMDFKCHGLTNPRNNLIDHLRDKQTLLVLDNTEHLLDGVELFAEILEKSPQIKLLITSRERLNLLSEWVFEIQGLPVPPSDQLEHFEEYSSVELFLQSARRMRADYELLDKERVWVARICQIMEGMPLGIEMAAAWVGLLSCEEIAKEIERNIDFLKVSMRDLPERHRSLRAVLDHSWNLLNSEEKAILSRLSVFRGSFRREAAEDICGASLAILSSLKDKSLLRRTDQGRYYLHELIQQYAALRLAEDAWEVERLKDRHAFYFAGRLSVWEKALKSSKQTDTLLEMAHEIDNLRQAWLRLVTCCIVDCDEGNLRIPSLFHSSLFSLSLFFEMRCRNREAISLFGESIEILKNARGAFESPEDKWFYETILGHITAYLGLHHVYVQEFPKASELLEEAMGLLENSMARLEKAQAQIMLAWIFHVQGQIQKSIILLKETLVILQEEGDTWWYALAITNLAWAYLYLGNCQEAGELSQIGFQLAEPGDLRLGIPIRGGLARVSCLQNDYAGAEQLLKENLDLSFQLGFKRQTAFCYLDLGLVALATDRIELADMNFQECVNLLSGFGDSHNLALSLVYSGKCLIARGEIEAARDKFRKVIQIGQSLDIFYLVYWGLVNLARSFIIEGQTERALEMALVLRQYSVEVKVAQDDGAGLMVDLQDRLSPEQVAMAADRIEDRTIESLLDII
jgi:predicted ATPase/transcriptional regulator with XRE-family HTH domain/tetratricopeptide (TPR) repeat protein